MILQLRHAVPWLQKFSGWSVYTIPPPLARRFAGFAAALAPGAGSNADTQPDPGSSNSLQAGNTADSGLEKKSRRQARGTKASAAGAPEAEGVADAAGGQAATAAARSGPVRRRTGLSRKAAPVTGGDGEGEEPDSGAAAPPPKRTRRKKQEESQEPTGEAGAAPDVGAEAEAQLRGDAQASPAIHAASPTGVTRKRTGKSSSRKAAAASGADSDAAVEEEAVSIRSLPYEDFLLLPRKAEHILIALGLRAPNTAAAAAARSTRTVGGGGGLGNILELASFLERPDPRELVTPLLLAQYQGYLGDSPDYLYDLFFLDFDPPFLGSEVVKEAVLEAASVASRPAALLSAKGSPPEALVQAAMDRLRARVGDAAVDAQEARAARITAAQLELFLLDWASARLAGPMGPGGIPYLARRSAALQLTRPIVVERLYRYAVKGQGLAELATSGSRTVKLTQPMEALVEGLKAGVRLDRERLLHDFRLTSPGSPLAAHLDYIWRELELEAGRILEPGSALYYSTLVEKLRVIPGIKEALRQQESQWQKEQGDRDGSLLTQAQVRLMFHLWRLDRYREEDDARRRRKAETDASTRPV